MPRVGGVKENKKKGETVSSSERIMEFLCIHGISFFIAAQRTQANTDVEWIHHFF